ncbi:UNVERIFIED_CONTAM: PAS domain S-box-containing protein [Acetivibrio alkalicellulosi]
MTINQNSNNWEKADFYKSIIYNSPTGYAYHKIICDEKGNPYDYEFVDVNPAFEKLTGLKSQNIIGKRITKVIPDIRDGNFDWVKFYGDITLNGEKKEFEQFSEPLNRWYRVSAFSPEKYHFITYFSEITEEKMKFQEMENFFQINLDLLCIADVEGNFIKVNKEWEAVLGYSLEELTKKKFFEFIHPDDLNSSIKAVSELRDQKQVLNFVNRFRCKNGLYKYIEWRSQPYGKLIYSAARDITQYKITQKALIEKSKKLEEEKQKLDYILDVTGAGVDIIDSEYNLKYVNLSWKKKYGDPFGMKCYEYFKGLNVPCENCGIKKALESKKTVLTEQIITKGEERFVEVHTVPFQDANGEWLVAEYKVDITKRKEMEIMLLESYKKFNTLFKTMTDIVVMHQLVLDEKEKPINYRIIDVNYAFTKITGITKKEAVGKLATEVYKISEPPYLNEYSKTALMGGSHHFNTYYPNMAKYFSISVISLGNNKFATVATDITEIKQSHQIIEAKNKELEQIIYVASHDLRSPLVNIDGYSRELEYSIKDIKEIINIDSFNNDKLNDAFSDIEDSLNHVRKSTHQMDELLKGLLKLSRAGRDALNICNLNMKLLINDVCESFEYVIKQNKVKVQIGELPPCRGDLIQVSQLFANVIGNALKYLDPYRSGEVKVSGQIQLNGVVYCVEDNGVGIAENHIDSIFEIFNRLNKGDREGEGLGLTIVRQILIRIGGEIRVESTVGEGSRFYITLPHIKNT